VSLPSVAAFFTVNPLTSNAAKCEYAILQLCKHACV